MHNCPNCGREWPDDAVFCAECGTKLETAENSPEPETPESPAEPETPTEPEQPQTPKTTSVAEQPQTTTQPAQDNAPGKKKGRGRLIGLIIAIVVVLVVIVVILVAAFSCSNSNVTDEQVEQDFKDSYIFDDGIMQSSYVEDSAYELLNFEVIEQSVESADLIGIDGNMLVISFSGTMENESFETEFDGHVFYVNDEGTWVEYMSTGFMIDDATTTPLKGVDYFDFSGTSSDNSTVGEFSSTLEQSNGEYVSVASQDISYDYWFATDSATYTETFVFENDMGWWPSSEAEISNTSTTWTLAGKTFEPLDTISLYYGEGLLDSTLSFTNIDSNGTVTADYTISYIPASGSTDEENENNTYFDVTLEGTLSGVAQHDFGWENFSFELNDPENGVTFTCSDGSETMVPGSGTVPTLWVSLATNTVYYRYSFDDSNSNDYTIEFYNETFAESTAA